MELFVLLSGHPTHPRRVYFSRRALAEAIVDGLVDPGAQRYGHRYPATALLRMVEAGASAAEVDMLALARQLRQQAAHQPPAARTDMIAAVRAGLEAAL